MKNVDAMIKHKDKRFTGGRLTHKRITYGSKIVLNKDQVMKLENWMSKQRSGQRKEYSMSIKGLSISSNVP